jgi:hypothetical protein
MHRFVHGGIRVKGRASVPRSDARVPPYALPMLDGARYRVTLGGRGGLVARPADTKTQELLDAAGW